MPNFTGQLNTNEIYAALFNMIISQEVFANNINDTYATLADRMRVDGSLYGDTKLYYSTDILESHPWGADSEAANLLELNRAKDPACQAIELNQFRQIRLTTDQYLSKRAWSNENAFSQFTSVITDWVRETKRVYDSRLMNTFVGTTESNVGKQHIEITLLPSDNSPTAQESVNRINAQTISRALADLMTDILDPNRDYNDYGYMRSYSPNNLIVIWNAKQRNKVTNMDLPTIFHDNKLFKNLQEMSLPARYFGDKVTTTNIASLVYNASTNPSGIFDLADGKYTLRAGVTSLRSLIETDIKVGEVTTHVFPADSIPAGAVFTGTPTNVYVENDSIYFKIIHERSVPFMSAFETMTNFWNPRSLTDTKYLTWGYNDLEYLKQFPFITIVDAGNGAAAAATE